MKSINSRLAFLTLVLILFIVSSCKKDPYEVGYDLLPGSDTLNVKTIDTVTVVAYSVLHDSIRTDKRSQNLIGSVNDPIFGTTTTNFYTQFRLQAEATNFGVSPVLDSVVLQLRYAGVYGDTNTLQTLKVYEISEDMFFDSSYYSNQSIETYGNLLAIKSFIPKPKDSILVDGVKTPPHIRINLSNLTKYFGNKLLSTPADVLSSNLSFIKYMKGLAIQSVPVNSGGGLFFISYKDVNTKLILYFHNAENDSIQFNFEINDLCTRANSFNHNGYSNASQDLKNQILNNDTTLGQEKLYIQGLGGVQVKVKIPYITELNKLGKIAINNARLVLTNVETDTTYSPVPALYLVKKDSAGRIAFLTDYTEGTSYFGGQYHKSTKEYSFRITRHLEQILLGKAKNYDLYILSSSPIETTLIPNRVILNGTNPSNPLSGGSRLRLEVIYTKLY